MMDGSKSQEFHEHLKNRLSVLGVDPAKVDWLKVAQLIGDLYRAFLEGSKSSAN